MSVTQYKGARYQPIFGRIGDDDYAWDINKEYEPLTIVVYDGNSYTSRQTVPAGVAIDNTAYWAETGNYNAQIESYRNDVKRARKLIEELGLRIDGLHNEIEFDIHPTRSKNDTGYVFIKIPRNMYELSFANTNGSDTDAHTHDESVLHYARLHPDEASFFTNCTFYGFDSDARLNGVDYHGTEIQTTSGRRYLAFTEDMKEMQYFPIETQIENVPERFTTVFAVGFIYFMNGITPPCFPSSSRPEPRNGFGWDDDYYYVLITEGRSNMNVGFTYEDVLELFRKKGVQNAVEFDGGGSTALIYSDGNITRPVNWYRDFANIYDLPRNTSLVAKYSLKEGVKKPINEGELLHYRDYNSGFTNTDMFKRNTGLDSLVTYEYIDGVHTRIPRITDEFRDVESSTRSLKQWARYRIPENFEITGNIIIPVPAYYKQEQVMEVFARGVIRTIETVHEPNPHLTIVIRVGVRDITTKEYLNFEDTFIRIDGIGDNPFTIMWAHVFDTGYDVNSEVAMSVRVQTASELDSVGYMQLIHPFMKIHIEEFEV